MADGIVDIVIDRLARVDHQAVNKLHRLGTLSTQLARDDDFAALGTGLHDVADNTVAGAASRQARKKLEAEGFTLGDRRQATILHLLGVKLDGAVGKLEALLDDGGQFADAAAILAENLLGAGGTDDDFSALRSDTHFHTGIAIFREKTSQKLVKLGIEDTVGNKLQMIKVRVF